MQAELTPLNGQKAIGITFTDKPVTAWGGLALFVAFAERIGLYGYYGSLRLVKAAFRKFCELRQSDLASVPLYPFTCGIASAAAFKLL